MRFVRDGSWQRFGRVVVAGSPLKIFRVSAAGERVVDAIEAHDDVGRSVLVDRLLDAGAVHPDVDDDVNHAVSTHVFTVDDITVVTPQFGGVAAVDSRITVDDGSRPPIVGAAIRLDTNRGPAAARNAARPLVTTALIAFVDADVDTFDNVGVGSWLLPLLAHFDDPRIGLVAPRVVGEDGSSIDLGETPARIRSGTRVSYVPAAAIVVRTDAFDDIGGFDESLRFGEDVDLVWRLDAAGWHCRYEPASAVWHEPRATLAGRMRQNAGYGTSAAPLALRHPKALAPVRTNGWTSATWALVAAGHPIVATGVAVGSAAALIPKLRDVPPTVAFRLAMTGHVRAVQQFASAARRVWWPIVALVALVSKRARLLGIAAVAVDVTSTPIDLAYGWGVWTGMFRHRTIRPIVPILVSWPGRST